MDKRLGNCNAAIPFDSRLAPCDIRKLHAPARMLCVKGQPFVYSKDLESANES